MAYLSVWIVLCTLRNHQAVSEGAKVVDIDGSYLYKKHQRLAATGVNVAPLALPSPPLSGWGSVTETNVKMLANNVPRVTSGNLSLYVSFINCRDTYHNTMIVALQVWSILTLLELWVILGARVPLELCHVATYTGHQGD